MASLLPPTIQQRHLAAREEFNRHLDILNQRMTDNRFPLTAQTRESIMKLASDMLESSKRIDELVSIAGRADFTDNDDPEYLQHVRDEVSDPIGQALGCMRRLCDLEIATTATTGEGLDMWRDEWSLVISHLQHGLSGVIISGQNLALLLTRRAG